MSDWLYVDQPDGLARFVACLADADRVALDTEADSFHHFHEKICLLQFNLDGRFFLVDPLAGLDLAPLFNGLAGRDLILHGADYDLRMLRSCFGFQAGGRVIDTTIAAQLLGIRAFGLAALLDQFFQVRMCKDDQRSDWSRRPLTQTQLAYAVEDVRYLPQLSDLLEARLAEAGRLDWFAESCAAQVAAAAIDRPRDPDREWRIKGSHTCDRRQLAFLRELWQWRQEEADRIDRPPFMILANAAMVELAVLAAAEARPNGLPGRFVPPRNLRDNQRAERLAAAIARAHRLPVADYPAIPRPDGKRLSSQQEETIRRLRDATAKLAAELGLDPPVLAPRAALGSIVEHRARTAEAIVEAASLLRWQAALLEPVAAAVL